MVLPQNKDRDPYAEMAWELVSYSGADHTVEMLCLQQMDSENPVIAVMAQPLRDARTWIICLTTTPQDMAGWGRAISEYKPLINKGQDYLGDQYSFLFLHSKDGDPIPYQSILTTLEVVINEMVKEQEEKRNEQQ